jgi:hypothetical protein
VIGWDFSCFGVRKTLRGVELKMSEVKSMEAGGGKGVSCGKVERIQGKLKQMKSFI